MHQSPPTSESARTSSAASSHRENVKPAPNVELYNTKLERTLQRKVKAGGRIFAGFRVFAECSLLHPGHAVAALAHFDHPSHIPVAHFHLSYLVPGITGDVGNLTVGTHENLALTARREIGCVHHLHRGQIHHGQ